MFIIGGMEDLENEIWVTTYLSPFYEVSNFGRVRSKDRYRPWKFGVEQFITSKLLNGRKHSGYILYDLMIENGEKKTKRIHQIVYHSFNNTKPIKGMTVDHIDGNKSNNNLENLQFITHEENCKKGKIHTEKKSGLPMYIKQDKGKYRVIKNLNGKKVSWGTFQKLEDAVQKRDELILNNWGVEN